MSPILPIAAVLPLQAGGQQTVFIDQSNWPTHDGLPVFSLQGVSLQLTFSPSEPILSISLGPAEWAKLATGGGMLYVVDASGETIGAHFIPALAL